MPFFITFFSIFLTFALLFSPGIEASRHPGEAGHGNMNT
jgi:hypothetical protein